MSAPLTSRNWLGKTSAGLILGLALAVGCSGLLFRAFAVSGGQFSLPGQFTMWAIAPIWCAVLSFCFFFRSGLRAWLILGAATALVWAALALTGALS